MNGNVDKTWQKARKDKILKSEATRGEYTSWNSYTLCMNKIHKKKRTKSQNLISSRQKLVKKRHNAFPKNAISYASLSTLQRTIEKSQSKVIHVSPTMNLSNVISVKLIYMIFFLWKIKQEFHHLPNISQSISLLFWYWIIIRFQLNDTRSMSWWVATFRLSKRWKHIFYILLCFNNKSSSSKNKC